MPVASNTTIANASANANVVEGFGSAFNLMPMIVVVFVLVLAILAVSILVNSLKAYEWFLELQEYFNASFDYALKGLATSIALAVIIGPIYYLSQADSQTRGFALKAIGAVIGGYLVLVVFGYVGDRVWQKISEQHEEVTGHKPFEGVEEDAEP